MHDGRDPLSALPPSRRSGAEPAAGAFALPRLRRDIALPKWMRGAVQEKVASLASTSLSTSLGLLILNGVKTEYMDDDGPVYIVRDHCRRVLISDEEYEGLKETIYLLQNTIREGKGQPPL